MSRYLEHLREHTRSRRELDRAAELYVSWWKSAFFTSGIDVSRNLIYEMHKRYGAPAWASTRDALSLGARRWSLPEGARGPAKGILSTKKALFT